MDRPTPTWAEQASMAYALFLLIITVSNGMVVSAQYSANRIQSFINLTHSSSKENYKKQQL
jgi:cell division protein FtsW (lipid II flippase)